ncbi:MAG: 23S rRNA (pseudouridine(1915)-N(3))-methyltransferase RlmH [Desulfovibrio sp.]|nr:23S rRNA (pseudouridine(1915)-N(3))-methyltransferase RlmH [Desulfovibrio sp.]
MAGTLVRLLCVGRLKTPFWREAAAHYAERLGRWRRVELVEVRDGDAALAPAQRSAQEGRRLLEALARETAVVALDEGGETLDSPGLAALLRRFDEAAQRPTFVIGGPFGLSPEVRAACPKRLSLSALTWPHELARVLLLEQLYRAECILRKIPYHH